MVTNLKIGSTPTIIVVVTVGGKPKDISSASIKKIFFGRPDGTTFEKPAEFTIDGKDGRIEYKFANTELDQKGKWRAQGYVEMGTDIWPTDIENFPVDLNIKESDA